MFLTLTAVNFVHVNGRSLYIDLRMVVVVGGKCHTPCKKGGGIARGGGMSRGNVWIPFVMYCIAGC